MGDNLDNIVPELEQNGLPPTEVRFSSMSVKELAEILGLTIKRDEHNKLVAFLALLSAYTEDSQLNVSFNAPSSTGKSYIPTEIAKLFPPEDVIEVGYTSPTAFFHDAGRFDKEKGGYVVDLSRKILIFLDQPHDLLLQHLRPLLSHDKREIVLKITDKSQKYGLKTKNVYLKGFPVVVFCTAGLNLDEQEATRFLLLSPEIGEIKIKEAIQARIRRETNSKLYEEWLLVDPNRSLLRQRIAAIKEAGVEGIEISDSGLVEMLFMDSVGALKPRHQRDIGKVISLIKAFALLNLWFRKREGGVLFADEDDIRGAFELWGVIAESQELNLPPYVYNLYSDVIVAVYEERNNKSGGGIGMGLSKQEIMEKHYKVYGRFLPGWQLNREILPLLETSGLISQEQDPLDKRRVLIYPTTQFSIFSSKRNETLEGGVGQEGEENEKNRTD